MFINSKLATNESTEINEPLASKDANLTMPGSDEGICGSKSSASINIIPCPVFAAQIAVVDQPLSYTHPLEPRQFVCGVERF